MAVESYALAMRLAGGVRPDVTGQERKDFQIRLDNAWIDSAECKSAIVAHNREHARELDSELLSLAVAV